MAIDEHATESYGCDNGEAYGTLQQTMKHAAFQERVPLQDALDIVGECNDNCPAQSWYECEPQ